MENGSFQYLNLTHLDLDLSDEVEFVSPSNQPTHDIPSFKAIQRDQIKSTSMETLMSQNEDLMARLKVTLRRLALLEDENSQLRQTESETQNEYSVLNDQMLIWKEKEKVWKNRNEELQKKCTELSEKLPDYDKLKNQLLRHKKYEEKVKLTIKPYVQQLKQYAGQLHQEIQGLHREIEMKDGSLLQTQAEFAKAKNSHQEQIQFLETSQAQLVHHFENSRQTLLAEIRGLQESNHALEQKTQQLHQTLERQDELENLVVALRRSRDEFHKELQTEVQRLRENSKELQSQLTAQSLQIETIQAEKEQWKSDFRIADSKASELAEQLSSLRYMWTAKSEENEKLKMSLGALEKMNKELSARLADLRKGT